MQSSKLFLAKNSFLFFLGGGDLGIFIEKILAQN